MRSAVWRAGPKGFRSRRLSGPRHDPSRSASCTGAVRRRPPPRAGRTDRGNPRPRPEAAAARPRRRTSSCPTVCSRRRYRSAGRRGGAARSAGVRPTNWACRSSLRRSIFQAGSARRADPVNAGAGQRFAAEGPREHSHRKYQRAGHVQSTDRQFGARRACEATGRQVRHVVAGPRVHGRLGASSFNLSRASGIMRPNMALSSAVGISPLLLLSWP